VHRRSAHRAGRADHEQPRAALHGLEGMPGGDIRHPAARRFLEAETLRLQRYPVCGKKKVFAMRPVAGKADLLSGAPYGLAEQRGRPALHDAREIPARRARQRGVGMAAHDVRDIAPVEPGGLDAHQHFVLARHRRRHLLDRQLREIARAVEAQCFHCAIATGSEISRRLAVRSMKTTSGASISYRG
jgi:hypothetical protein